MGFLRRMSKAGGYNITRQSGVQPEDWSVSEDLVEKPPMQVFCEQSVENSGGRPAPLIFTA